MVRYVLFCLAVAVGFFRPSLAQQLGDVAYEPHFGSPAFADGMGPKVLIDEAHNNFHTSSERFKPFAELLRRDGYAVDGLRDSLMTGVLERTDVLVIANALATSNIAQWALPTPSAFSDDEIDAVYKWVRDGGGALLLVADHMPFPGAVERLAARFGVLLSNGFALRSDSTGVMVLRREDGAVGPHPITEGRNPTERIDSVKTFTGQAFRIAPGVDAGSLLMMGPDVMLLFPEQAWQFSPRTPAIRATGMLQGAAVSVGKGRVVAMGEAAMLTAQLAGPNLIPMGMNDPGAPQNAQFALNILHWLTGLIPDQ